MPSAPMEPGAVRQAAGPKSRHTGRLLRFSGARRRDPAIAAWLRKQAPALGAIAKKWLAVMRERGDDVRELMHDGCPVVCVEDAPFAYVNVFTAHANVGFYLGAALADAKGLLQGEGKRMRHVKLRPGAPIDAEALAELIEQAYLDIKQRLAAEQLPGSAAPPF